MHIDGSCHCGSITYEAEVNPNSVGICHCTDCQILSGSTFRIMVPAAAADFRLLTGEPRRYVKTAESGTRRVQAFCPDCGTPIYSCAAGGAPPFLNLRLGTVRQRSELRPSVQIWCRSAQPWLAELASVPQIARQR